MPRKAKTARQGRNIIPRSYDQWSIADQDCARLFTACCNVPQDRCQEITGVSSYRLKEWNRAGYIEKKDSHYGAYYRTTERGREVFSTVTGVKAYISNSIRHDMGLVDLYKQIPEEYRSTYMPEPELRRYALEEGIDIEGTSIPDGAFFTAVGLVCIEVITKHYSQETITMKQEFANRIGGLYEQSRI